MNHHLQKFARHFILDGLVKLPEDWQNKFKLMYGITRKTPVEKALAKNINDIIDKIPEEKLDWAMIQVENSLKKLDLLRSKNEDVSALSSKQSKP